MRRNVTRLLLAGLVASTACADGVTAPDAARQLRADAASTAMTRAAADFPTWRQGFNHGTAGWIGSETAGPGGWCGEIEAVAGADGPVKPSAGRGYAVARFGDCNDYWAAHGFPDGSAPYSPGAGYSGAWPEGGYVTELDIYLDPAWSAPTPFVYGVSFSVLDLAYPNNFRYFLVPVTGDGFTLRVGEHAVTEAGWYTFRHRFGSRGGALTVRFELERDGRPVGAHTETTTAFTAQPTSSFDAADTGTGYIWFVSVAEGLDLPIDEHRVRRGG